MASSPITSWQTDGEKMETVTDFIFLGSKITVDGDCSHEINRRAVINLDSILKCRDITLPTKVCLVKAIYGFSSSHVWMWELMLLNYGVGEDSLESLRLARRSNQSILKEIIREYSLDGLMLKLKLQHFGHLIRRTDSLEKTLMLGKIEGRRRRDDRGWDVWMASLTQWPWVWASSRNWWWTGKPGELQSVESDRVGHNWVTELNWTERSCNVFSQPKRVLWGFPSGSDSKESASNAVDLGSIPGLGRSPEEGNGSPLQYSCLENPMDGGAWRATIHGVTKSWKSLND